MKVGRLFEQALRAAQVELRPGVVLRIKVEGHGRRLKLLVNRGTISDFEATVLERSRRANQTTLPYQPAVPTGERIRITRRAAGLTLAQLADRASVTKGTLSSIELGKRPVGLQVLRRIAKSLGVSPSALIAE